jgi:predicted NUDIX family phosphoesterase
MESILCIKAIKGNLPILNNITQIPLKTFLEGSEIVSVVRNKETENNRNLRQLVAVAIFQYKDLFLRYQRQNNEHRLTGLNSCLVGGHVKSQSENSTEIGITEDWIGMQLLREIQEEVKVSVFDSLNFCGYLYKKDSLFSVDNVHLGLLYKVVVPVMVRAHTEGVNSTWCSYGVLKAKLEFPYGETWGSMLVESGRDHFDDILNPDNEGIVIT